MPAADCSHSLKSLIGMAKCDIRDICSACSKEKARGTEKQFYGSGAGHKPGGSVKTPSVPLVGVKTCVETIWP